MMKTYMNILVVLAATFIIAGCSGGQSVIKGTVVMRTGTEGHINLGSTDGIQVGDTLSVWRNESTARSGSRTIRAGEVRVIRILGKDYSAVEVLNGNLNEKDVVEKWLK